MSRTYYVRVGGRLGPEWAHWFGSWTLEPQPGGDTVLIGTPADQAALHGILARVRDLGIVLLSVTSSEDACLAKH